MCRMNPSKVVICFGTLALPSVGRVRGVYFNLPRRALTFVGLFSTLGGVCPPSGLLEPGREVFQHLSVYAARGEPHTREIGRELHPPFVVLYGVLDGMDLLSDDGVGRGVPREHPFVRGEELVVDVAPRDARALVRPVDELEEGLLPGVDPHV